MPVSEARVRTPRASRYLTQLCDHGSKMHLTALHRRRHRAHSGGEGEDEGGGPPKVLRAESSDTEGVIDFGWGRCVLRAADDELVLTAEAQDETALRRIEDGLRARLERIGRRDGLTAVWTPATPDPTSQDATED
ncbi:DUF2218 domain-containing protein [Actinocrinis puniceicyclus]|uniref:DUF2218 domain-containing protein n=1 Tax=Actinocrinis puniceicyclus TaxID=977794 RepID=A0A8J7WIM0_9ACTN|nr:DUF2218 domain-containing protein [Actinocrinis puniceicyclus]MBS2961998.1 DUF2218 domain-containing protein [Actinocrinis puniceicyclus]